MKKLCKIALALGAFLIIAILSPLSAGAACESPDFFAGDDVPGVPSAQSFTHTVTFFDGGDAIFECTVENGGALSGFPTPSREGYKLVGWRVGGFDGELFEPSTPITESLELYAEYELLPPSFDISSLSFSYDGAAHTLAFSSLTHPLIEGGVLSYEWYKDGLPLGAYGSSLSLTSVAEGGEYSCRIVFSVGGDVAEITTPPIAVAISKCEISIPTLAPTYYTGDSQAPALYDNGCYTVDRTAYTLAGTYPVTLLLLDPDNYAFSGTDEPSITVDMVILPAENFWVVTPSVSDVFASFSPSPTGLSRFGTTAFLYSSDGVEYTADIPTRPGKYLMRAEVAADENYSALVSDPMPFSVLAEEVVGIAVKAPADKMTYQAFEAFDPTGLTVGVTYNSGRYETVGADSLTVAYQQADSFRYRDSGVIISYCGSSVLLRTTVLRADYDLSGISLPDTEAVYGGAPIGIDFIGSLPVGLDGIPLTATVSGGGADVGTYTVTLSFFTESDSYNRPSPLNATLTILPRTVSVVWSELSFVYDGEAKLPSAYYLDVHGRKTTLTPTGARSFAGEYTASVTSPDPNYSFKNPSAVFEILKADYDVSSVVWQGGGEVYDGGEKRVFLTGLPEGVTVVGCVNGTATEAGEYTATAALSYDNLNYNPPEVPSYTWQIKKASYSTDGFAFYDVTAVYDGEAHYPRLEGELPRGIDGIALEYSFVGSATHVADGRISVSVVFSTKSTNYLVPDPQILYVEILPKDISVSWENAEFRYTGAPLLPKAVANECKIRIEGGGISAGEHTAVAFSENSDYRVVNDTYTYLILKAYNSWLDPLSVSDVFFGRTPTPSASALAGEVVYTYYRDPECTLALDGTPSSVGVYYVLAHSGGDENHEPITSAPVRLEIIAILPVALEITLDRAEYTALDSVTFSASLLNNDGSYTALAAEDVSVLYQSADTLRFGDTGVSFTYGDFTADLPVTVIKRDYDITGILWSFDAVVYDGLSHSVTLRGLPDGVTVREYLGNGFICAGEYTVSAVLDYDRQNYNAPVVPSHTVRVEKCPVPLPVISSAEYDGTPHTAYLLPSTLYTATPMPTATRSGKYPITLTLTDPDNYTFGEGSVATVYFSVVPRRLTVRVSDFDLYLFERRISPTYEITGGALIDGDALNPAYRVTDGLIFADFYAPDYEITVIPGTLRTHSTLSERATSTLIFVILAVVLLILILIAVLTNRRRIVGFCRSCMHQRGADDDNDSTPPPPDVPTAPDASTAPEAPPDEPASVSDAVDAEYADSVITNSLAKDLIRRAEDVVTNGSRRGIVNVDTLSRSFSAGDRVDINSLKSHSLIPYDTAYVKVLARGMIDKPLDVFANDFSLSAVKMIALCGGKAVKVNTVIKNK